MPFKFFIECRNSYSTNNAQLSHQLAFNQWQYDLFLGRKKKTQTKKQTNFFIALKVLGRSFFSETQLGILYIHTYQMELDLFGIAFCLRISKTHTFHNFFLEICPPPTTRTDT